jgi:hypothetical protein
LRRRTDPPCCQTTQPLGRPVRLLHRTVEDRLVAGARHAVEPADAPVTIVGFTDYDVHSAADIV